MPSIVVLRFYWCFHGDFIHYQFAKKKLKNSAKFDKPIYRLVAYCLFIKNIIIGDILEIIGQN